MVGILKVKHTPTKPAGKDVLELRMEELLSELITSPLAYDVDDTMMAFCVRFILSPAFYTYIY